MTARFSKYALLVLGIFYSCLFFVTLRLHPDHTQILKKVFRLIDTGVWTHYGNAGTGVGFVPGTFLTAIAAIPMQIYFSPYSAMAVILLFHLISWVLLNKILKESSGPLIVLDFLLLYWLSPWRVEQSELYNPGYLFLFAALHLYTAYYMKEKNFWLTFFHVLAVGFCGQVHYSVLILVVLSLLLLWVRYLKVDWRGFLAGVFVVLLSLVPYVLQYISDQHLQVTLNKSSDSFLGRNLVMVYPVLKGIVYWLRYGAIYYGRHIFSEINFLWMSEGFLRTLVSQGFHILKWILAAVTLIWSFKIQGKLLKDYWKKEKPFSRHIDRSTTTGRERIYAYGFYMFIAMLIAVALSPVEFNHWHLILCFPLVTMWMSMAFHDLRAKFSPRQFKFLFVAVLLAFSMFDILGALGSRSHSADANFHQEVLEFYDKKPHLQE